MTEPDCCVVVPTVREYECVREYVANARAHGFDTDRLEFVLVTEDFCDTDAMASMLADLGVAGEVFDGSRRESWLRERGVGEYGHLIPEASHAQTSFGLLYLWANDHDYGFFVDDDTRPLDNWNYFGRHLRNLGYSGEVERVRSDERWVNVLYQSDHDLYPRGYPYSAMGETVETETVEVGDVVVSQGLWTNVPDLDAVRILMDGDLQGQAETRTTRDDFDRDFVTAPGNYLTVCSMNLAFEREVVPAFYQFPMDDNPWDVGRFDDIWSGVLVKRAADLLGKQVLTGFPLCEHNKAPRSTFDDLANEVPGLELNEHVWEIVDRVEPEARRDGRAVEPGGDAGEDADSYAAVAAAAGRALADGDWSDYNSGGFLNYCGEYTLEWLECLDALAPAEDRARERVSADD